MVRVRTVAALRAVLDEAGRRFGGGTATAAEDAVDIALVPTMGFLHEGHLSLVDRARERARLVVVSIFVNPLQFGEGEDLDSYPRDEERDAGLLEERGADVLFAPGEGEMYPTGAPEVRVATGPMGDVLCGAFRPGHFEGVLTVVAKLLNQVRPDLAVFGGKDYQQAVLVRRMVADLDFATRIDVAPIVREADGLAMSSRNAYLAPAERRSAAALHRGLERALERFRAGERDGAVLGTQVRTTIEAEEGAVVQYVDVVDAGTLESRDVAAPGNVLAVAAFIGRTRLIDNVILN